MPVYRETVTVSGAAGGSGAATATARTSRIVEGKVVAVHLSYTDSPPSTTDVTITEATNSPAAPVLAVSNANANGWFYPAYASVATDAVPPWVADYLTVTIAQANNGDGVVATIIWVAY